MDEITCPQVVKLSEHLDDYVLATFYFSYVSSLAVTFINWILLLHSSINHRLFLSFLFFLLFFFFSFPCCLFKLPTFAGKFVSHTHFSDTCNHFSKGQFFIYYYCCCCCCCIPSPPSLAKSRRRIVPGDI